MLGVARGARGPAVEAAGRAEHLAAERDVRGDDTVATPELLGLVEVLDDRDLTEQVMDEARRGRADVTGDPPDAVAGRTGVGRSRQVIERQKGRRAERMVVQVRDRRASVLEAL